MRKIISLVTSAVLLTNMSLAHTITLSINGMELKITADSGTEVKLSPKADGIMGWTATGVNLTAAQQSSTSINFTMPANNVTLTANYKDLTISEIPVGSYIQYVPSISSYAVERSTSGADATQTFIPSDINSWKVLKNNNGQLDIISKESVGNLKIQGATGYLNIVDTLNNLCSAYVNPKYADSGRCPGYVDGSSIKKIQTGSYPLKYNVSGLPYADAFYGTDSNQIINYGLLQSSGSIWLASRGVNTTSDVTHFRGVDLLNSGTIHTVPLYYAYSNNTTEEASAIYGVRPIVSLKSNLKIAGGMGTIDKPYSITLNVSE